MPILVSGECWQLPGPDHVEVDLVGQPSFFQTLSRDLSVSFSPLLHLILFSNPTQSLPFPNLSHSPIPTRCRSTPHESHPPNLSHSPRRRVVQRALVPVTWGSPTTSRCVVADGVADTGPPAH